MLNLQFRISFYNYFDAFLIGLGALFFQPNNDNKIQVISYKSQILTTQQQKLSNMIENFVL